MPTHVPRGSPIFNAAVDKATSFEFDTSLTGDASQDQWNEFRHGLGKDLLAYYGLENAGLRSGGAKNEAAQSFWTAMAQGGGAPASEDIRSAYYTNKEQDLVEYHADRDAEKKRWQIGMAVLAGGGLALGAGGAGAAAGGEALSGVSLPASAVPIGGGAVLPGVAGTAAEVLGTTGAVSAATVPALAPVLSNITLPEIAQTIPGTTRALDPTLTTGQTPLDFDLIDSATSAVPGTGPPQPPFIDPRPAGFDFQGLLGDLAGGFGEGLGSPQQPQQSGQGLSLLIAALAARQPSQLETGGVKALGKTLSNRGFG